MEQAPSTEKTTPLLVETPQKPQEIQIKDTQEAKEKDPKLAFVLFAVAGVISIYPEFVMLAQSGIMEEIFPQQEYSFVVLIPLYTSIPRL